LTDNETHFCICTIEWQPTGERAKERNEKKEESEKVGGVICHFGMRNDVTLSSVKKDASVKSYEKGRNPRQSDVESNRSTPKY